MNRDNLPPQTDGDPADALVELDDDTGEMIDTAPGETLGDLVEDRGDSADDEPPTAALP
jgi:hypothetical protein